ncbi:MAG TPA: hypothetical protein VNO18_07860 [Xanthobacteraceae bacterium]|nr:hypothetical protein [Xanthobacteraceae bacterium]
MSQRSRNEIIENSLRKQVKLLPSDNLWRAAELASAALSYGHHRLSRSRPMRPEEGTDLAHRQRNPLLRFLPRVNAYLGIRREHRGLHGNGVGMRRDIIKLFIRSARRWP